MHLNSGIKKSNKLMIGICTWTLLLGGAQIAHSEDDIRSFELVLDTIEIEKTSSPNSAKKSIHILKENYPQLSPEQQELYQLFYSHSLALDGKFDESIKGLEDLINSSKNKTLIIRAHALVSNIYLFAGNYEQAYFHASDAIEGLDEMGDHPWHKYAALQNLTSLFRQSGMTNTAIGYARQMLKVVNHNKYPLQLCGGYFELADLELSVKNVDMARIHSEEAMVHCKEANDPIYYTMALNLQTKLLLQANKSEQALKLLEEQYPKVKSIDYKTLTNVFEVQLASTYFEVKDFDNALIIAKLAYQRAEKMNDKVRLMELSKVLASIYSETGELEKAVDYYRQYIELEKEIDIMTNKRKMAYYMVSRRK